ncbi:MAG: hypothetical protein U0Z53_30965 [Blastocatellia bacterium]
MNTTQSSENEQRIIDNLLRDTLEGRVRWGIQPPSTIQTNRGKLHYVLRVRMKGRRIYTLTARRDGGKTVNFTIERPESETDALTRLYRFATQKQS